MPDIRSCSCCGKEKEVFVACSMLGAISFAYCADCLNAGVEPYDALVDYISFAGAYPEDIQPDWLDFIKLNLEFYNKTEEQFKKDLRKAEEAMSRDFCQIVSQTENWKGDF